MKIRKIKKGFTVLETLIASAISISLVSFITSFLWSFNSYSTVNIIKSTINTDLVTTQKIFEKELLPARSIIKSYTTPEGITKNTNSNTLIFSVPVYKEINGNSYNWPTTLNSQDITKNDIVIIELENLSSEHSEKLLMSYFPSSDSNRKKSKRAIHSYISSKFIDTNTNSLSTYPLFSFIDKSGNPISISNSGVNENVEKSSIVNIQLWAKYEHGKGIWQRKNIEIKLRNFGG